MLNMSKKNGGGSTKYINEELKSIFDEQGEDSLEKLQIQYQRLKSIHEKSITLDDDDLAVSSLTL